jgi:hypothetical protein
MGGVSSSGSSMTKTRDQELQELFAQRNLNIPRGFTPHDPYANP